jgi:hypothetical protein
MFQAPFIFGYNITVLLNFNAPELVDDVHLIQAGVSSEERVTMLILCIPFAYTHINRVTYILHLLADIVEWFDQLITPVLYFVTTAIERAVLNTFRRVICPIPIALNFRPNAIARQKIKSVGAIIVRDIKLVAFVLYIIV